MAVTRWKCIGWLWVVLASVSQLHAAAALFVEQPFGTFGEMNPTGHAAVYLSNICAETPTELRLCRPGETGVVISRYHHVAGRDWIGIPLIPYLYAVERPEQVPASVDAQLVSELRDTYRRDHLEALIPDGPEGKTPDGEWTQLIGSSYDRKIYAFEIETTREQDLQLIARLNGKRNKAHFNLFFRNCADFSREMMNTYYPGAVHRSIIADAGITTPKEAAKTLVAYSQRHSDLWFTEFEIPQVPGTLRRSKPVHGVCESLVRSKKYAVPLVLLHPWVGASIATAYLTRGRFNPEKHAIKIDGPEDVEQELMSGDSRLRRPGQPSLDTGILAWSRGGTDLEPPASRPSHEAPLNHTQPLP
jgi:hypothetical protein